MAQVLKKGRPKVLNDNCPVALKTLSLANLSPLVRSALDPLQFAYQQHIGVDDAVIYLLKRAHSHVDKQGSTVRIMLLHYLHCWGEISVRCRLALPLYPG